MNKEEGFTLIELLIVLLIFSMVALFILPSMYKSVARQEQLHFFKLLSSDIFYVQNKSLFKESKAEIVPSDKRYVIRSTFEREERLFPNDVTLASYPQAIHYSRNGTIKKPMTYLFDTEDIYYRVILPFGKGRNYLDES